MASGLSRSYDPSAVTPVPEVDSVTALGERLVFSRIFVPTVMAEESPGKRDLGGGREGKPRTSLMCLMFTSNLPIYESLF